MCKLDLYAVAIGQAVRNTLSMGIGIKKQLIHVCCSWGSTRNSSPADLPETLTLSGFTIMGLLDLYPCILSMYTYNMSLGWYSMTEQFI